MVSTRSHIIAYLLMYYCTSRCSNKITLYPSWFIWLFRNFFYFLLLPIADWSQARITHDVIRMWMCRWDLCQIEIIYSRHGHSLMTGWAEVGDSPTKEKSLNANIQSCWAKNIIRVTVKDILRWRIASFDYFAKGFFVRDIFFCFKNVLNLLTSVLYINFNLAEFDYRID